MVKNSLGRIAEAEIQHCWGRIEDGGDFRIEANWANYPHADADNLDDLQALTEMAQLMVRYAAKCGYTITVTLEDIEGRYLWHICHPQVVR